ncbi:MAG: HEAT repeat domain-containing protein [Deltaproteobacteria bacterium]|nr:HEAT repeat domain-containing protein [Deltaproteobacteria bacterium]
MRPSPLPAVLAGLLVAFTMPPAARAAALTLATRDDGSIVLKEGESPAAAFMPKTPAAQRGPATLRETTVSGRAVVEVRVPVRGSGPQREEVWIAERAGTSPKVIWWDLAGAADADGETARVVKVSPQGIEEYQTARRLSRCDGAEVPLFRRAWDFATRGFRPAAPALPARAPTTLQARRGNAPAGKPLGGFFFAAASSSLGAGRDASRLRPPAAVNDGNPETAWSTDGSGRGHLLTARSSGGFAITGLRLLPGDTTSQPRFRASAKPKRLLLVLGRDPADNIEVELVEDSDGGSRRFREPFWIPLPKPVAASCVTVVVREVTSDRTPMSVTELDVMTELDGPEAADRLVASLAEGTSCQARRPLLVPLGASALAKVSSAIASAAPGTGRECLIQALGDLLAAGVPPTSEAAAALVAATSGASETEERTIVKLLPTLPNVPVDAVAATLNDDKRSDRERVRAARVLAAIDGKEARAKLLAAVGRGSRALRKVLRALLAVSKPPALAAVLSRLESTPVAETTRRADFLAILGALATREPAARPQALIALRDSAASAASFEERARAIQSLGLLAEPAAIEALIAVRTNEKDSVLRGLAIGEFVDATGAAVTPALRAALGDTDPLVREMAAAGLGRKRDKEAVKLLVAGAEQEPWPSVRKAEIAALGELCTPEGNALLVRAFHKDVEEVRQAALGGLAHCYQAKATGLLLRTLGRLAESADMRSLAARLLGARKDPRTVPGLAEVLSRLLSESQADLSLEGVIAETAMALAAIRTPPAISALAGLVSDRRPSVQRIGIDALGVVCDPDAGAAALRAAAAAQDESVSARAAAAAAHCRERP